jgi:hypothetical protein
MTDFPDYILLYDPAKAPEFPGFPHRLVLIPNKPSDGPHRPVFLIEPDSSAEVLNGTALDGYMRLRLPVSIRARRGRDLRPFLKRAAAFQKRGYKLEVAQ